MTLRLNYGRGAVYGRYSEGSRGALSTPTENRPFLLRDLVHSQQLIVMVDADLILP